jgi:periplasmic divalent cation tolerance protein
MRLIFVYITNPTRTEAKKIGLHLVKKKLAACANIFQIESIYPWEGKIADEKEFVLIAKTDAKNYGKIVKEVGRIHSYTIPCIIKIPVIANKKYDKWLLRCLKE